MPSKKMVNFAAIVSFLLIFFVHLFYQIMFLNSAFQEISIKAVLRCFNNIFFPLSFKKKIVRTKENQLN